MYSKRNRTTEDKLKLFGQFFTGLPSAYGTYNPATGQVRQVKAPVTDKIFLAHLKGKQPYGIYLLTKNRTRAIAVDFDTHDRFLPMEFMNTAKHYGISSYIERSKSKGYHVWIFISNSIPAYKARLVVKLILDEIEEPDTEIFPKHDSLENTNLQFGNFINAPLFGALVPEGKTVFVDPATFKPYPDQWALLESIQRIKESALDEIIELNDLYPKTLGKLVPLSPTDKNKTNKSYALPPCAQKMLLNGVSEFQRVSCFRLAVHLKRIGLPYDMAVAALKVWTLKNRPIHGKNVISEGEVLSQAAYAYKKSYSGYGCDSPAISTHCDLSCSVKLWRKHSNT